MAPSNPPPPAFKGDGEGMVDLLVDACVRANETTRTVVAASGAAPPRAGRDLVPYFNPGSTDWGINDVNGNTDDSDSADGSSRGYDSSESSSSSPKSARRKGIKVAAAQSAPKKQNAAKKNNKHKREKVVANEEVVSPKAANVPTPATLFKKGQTVGGRAYAGTRFSLASPLPETLPMPTASLLGSGPKPSATASATTLDATSALRNFLQIEATQIPRPHLFQASQTAVLA